MKFRRMRFGKKFFAVVMVLAFAMNIVTPAMAALKDKRVENQSSDPITATELGLADPNDTYTVDDGTYQFGGAVSNTGTITGTIYSNFKDNKADGSGMAFAGAIFNGKGSTIESIKGSTFTSNSASVSAIVVDTSVGGSNVAGGGAIGNCGKITSITDATFTNNFATASGDVMAGGGAIGNYINSTIESIVNSTFVGNHAETDYGNAGGGAICNFNGTITTIKDSTFTKNYIETTEDGYAVGGAIYNYKGNITTIQGTFTENHAKATQESAFGGAVANEVGTIKSIENTSFTGNTVSATGEESYACGGAIMNRGEEEEESDTIIGSIESITNTSFTGNSATATGEDGEALGGAIANQGGTIESITNTSFTGNTVTATAMALGGAIVDENDENSEGSEITITNSSFAGNNATATGSEGCAVGGALVIPVVKITDTSFTGNTATAPAMALGGAILTLAGQIEADTKDVVFSGNKVSGENAFGSAIYVGMPDPESTDDSPTLRLQAASGKKITFDNDQTIEGTSGYTVDITGSGTVVFKQDQATNFKNAGIYGANVSVSEGATLHLAGDAGIFGSAVKLDNATLDLTDGKTLVQDFTSLELAGNGYLKLDADLAQEKMDTITSQSISGSAKLHITTLALLTDTAKNKTKINFTTDEDLKSLTRYDKEGAEIRSHTFNYIAKYDNTTGDFTFTNVGVSETTKAVSDTANVMNFAWLQSINNLQKRLGDLRGGEESNLAWIRFQRSNDDFQGTRHSNISGNMYQVGYDFALGNDSTARGYFGVSLERFDGTQSFQSGNGDVKSTSLGAYYTKIYNSGHYFDFIFRYGRYENDAKSYDAGITTQLDYAMNGVTLSGEYGYRANLGKGGIYLEPQAEFIYGYLAGAQKRSSTNYLADIDSTNHFVTRLGLALGQRVKNFNYYLRASYYHNFAGSTNIKYGDASYKQDGAQNWWEVSLGGGWNISKISYFYAELTKHFKDVSNSLNFNLGFRISL